MRTYGRIPVVDANGIPTGAKQWVEVTTDANGFNDSVYVTALAQVLLLNLNESPFWANYGIPARQSVITQVFPDYYVIETQKRFSSYFSVLLVAKLNVPTPTYLISIITKAGAKLNFTIPVPT